MWLDRTVVRTSLLVAAGGGVLVAAWLVLERNDAAKPPQKTPASELSCQQHLDSARRAMTRSKLDADIEVRELEQLAQAVASKRCRDDAEALIDGRARWYHREAETDPVKLGRAERLYDAYLVAFRDGPHFAEDQYYRAEVAWTRAETESNPQLQRDRWERAAVWFGKVVATRNVEAKLLKEAAYAAVRAWHNTVANDEEPTDDNMTLLAIPPARQALIGAFRDYRAIASDDEAVGMMFLEANMLRHYGHFDEALPLFVDILDHHREHETAEYAANLMLDTYNRLGRYPELVALARHLMSDRHFLADKPELAANVAMIDRAARIRHAHAGEP